MAHRPSGHPIAALLLLLPFTGCLCFGPPPGKGAKAELGYERCAPIIEALAAYRQRESAYPETLEALVTAKDLTAIPLGPQDGILGYTRTTRSYELSFHYEGPGMNNCTYKPESKWSCSGYF